MELDHHVNILLELVEALEFSEILIPVLSKDMSGGEKIRP
jgi:hypothetical protein